MENENQIEHVEAVVVTANALEQMERASIDIQIATAHKYPRSMDLFYKRATAMVTFDAETAASCLYRRPVGKEDGKMKFAEGESIRLAEIVAASYGNLRVAGMIIEMEPRYVKAVGIAHDLESNYAVRKEVVESTVTKHGVPFSERMRLVVAKAAQSKAIRDATFSVVPKSLCKPLVNKAKDVAKGDVKTFEAKRKAVVAWIKELKIEPKRVWDAIGIKGEADISVEVLLLLHGLKTAIDEGDCTVNDAFPKPEAEQKGSTVDRILAKDHIVPKKGKKTTKKKEKPKTEPGNEPDQENEPPESETEAEKEEPKLVKCPICSKEVDSAKPHDCSEPGDAKATGPTEDTLAIGKATHKCGICDRQFTKEELLDDGKKCPKCFSLKILELS